jgi:hypothetical protein
MTNTATGIDFSTYLAAILRYGDSVVRTPVVKTTSNITGDAILTDGTPVTINAYIVRKDAKWFAEKSGYLEGGDAVMLIDSSLTMSKDDKITWKGDTFRVGTVLDRNNLGGNTAYLSCQLFLIQ